MLQWFSKGFQEVSIPKNSSITKEVTLPVSWGDRQIWVGIANTGGVFMTTYSTTGSTITFKANNATSSANTLSRVNIITVGYKLN